MAKNRPHKKVLSPKVRENKRAEHKPAEARSRVSFHLKLALLLGLVVFVVYGNTLKNGFVLDDSIMLVNNKIVNKGVSAIPELLATPHQRGCWIIPNDEYRPLPLIMLSVIYQFFELNPIPYHFVNILLFAGCVVLLFVFLDKLFERKKTAVAFIASLLFALHPVHTEIVANIKSGDELLCFFFAFLSLNVFLRYAQSGRFRTLLAGAIFYLLSFLSKETTVTFLAVIPLVFFFFRNEHKRRSVHILVCAVLASAVFLIARYSVLRFYDADHVGNVDLIENALANGGLSFESRVATALLIMGQYVKLMFIPYPLVCDYSFNSIPYVHLYDPRVLASVAVYIFVLLFGIKRLAKGYKDPYAFGIFFFLITISLFSNVFILIKSTMGERFLFFPSVGFCLVAALVIERWFGRNLETGMRILKNAKVLAILVLLCLVYSFIVVNRNADWSDNYTLFSKDIEKVPNNSHLNYVLGFDLFSKAKQEPDPELKMEYTNKAITFFRKSVDIYPGYYYGLNDLGAAYFYKGRNDSAEIYDRAALALFPQAMIPRNNLSGVYIRMKKYREDIELCKGSIEFAQDNIYAYADISMSYLSIGKYDSAIHYLNNGILVDPKFYWYYQVYSYVYTALNIPDSVRKYEGIAKNLSAYSN